MAAARSIGTLVYTESLAYRAHKAFVAAKFNGMALDSRLFDAVKESKTPAFFARNPTGKVPYLDTEFGCIAGSNAIAKYVAQCRRDSALCGKVFDDRGQIDTWLEFCLHELEVPLMTWVYPLRGLLRDPPANIKTLALADVKKALGELEARLKGSAFLLGDYVSLADIVLVCTLREGFERVFDEAIRRPYPNVCCWFERCCALPQFAAVLGKVQLCKEAPATKNEAIACQNNAVAPAKTPEHGTGGNDARAPDVQAIGQELRSLTEKLKNQGVSGKKRKQDPEIKALVQKLKEAKAAAAAEKMAAPEAALKAEAQDDDEISAQVKAVGDELRQVKEQLRLDGLSGKKLNEHTDVKGLVARILDLKGRM